MANRCDEERIKPSAPEREPIDLDAIRARLDRSKGREYWRSLEELAGTPRFQEFLHREFPSRASEFTDPVGRRQFLRLMGASLALAGAGSCTKQPPESIVPYVRQPEEIVPGKPLFFATAMSLGGVGTGVLVESHMGRPTKIEGNPDHPSSLGATDVFAQASILSLYDPDRSQTLTHLGEIRPWSTFLGVARGAVGATKAREGAGFRILTERITSPTLGRQITDLLRPYPAARWHQYEPAGPDNRRAGTLLAFGQVVDAQYRIEAANVIVSMDDDFLACGPDSLRHARAFSKRRRVDAGDTAITRLYVVESTPSATGSRADHRLALRAADVEACVQALAARLGIAGAGSVGAPSGAAVHAFVEAAAADLQAHRGAGLVVAGDHQSPAVHALVHAINQTLGNNGRTVEFAAPIAVDPVDHTASLVDLVSDMDAGTVDVLLILGGNPVYTAPADLKFGERLGKVGLRIHLGLYDDETSSLCQWHIPETHYLEAWSDVRAADGTVSIVQPLIAPLYGGKSAHDAIAAFTDRPERSAYDTVREYWEQQYRLRATGSGLQGLRAVGSGAQAAGSGLQGLRATGSGLQASGNADGGFEKFWRRSLHDGVIAGTAFPTRPVSLRKDFVVAPTTRPAAGQDLEVVFRLDPTVHDGRFSNNGWLQELPKPITKITWDNAVLLSPATAQRLGVLNEDLVRLTYQGRSIEAPIWIVPGHANESATLHLGYGRMRAGRIGTGPGFNAYALRTSAAPWFDGGLQIEKIGGRYRLAATQEHHLMEGRAIVRVADVEEYRRNPHVIREQGEEPPKTLTLYPAHEYTGYAWGMAIDVNVCTGCNACVVACQAENNVPVVGKDQVARGREMHWLRVDHYYRGDLDDPEMYHQPVPCMHCENAPCEVVCPVGATVHSSEGLNDMVYNRCVGTRYCSNNCPYKVRRFNFLLYQDWNTPSLKLQRNPDVTVRSRGVMEKCTYCVQRINAAKIDAEKDDRSVRDGEIRTACEAVCPTEAIVFGNINDPTSRVSKLKAAERNYALLAELNTRPRTTYLAAVRNPNPALAGPTREPREER